MGAQPDITGIADHLLGRTRTRVLSLLLGRPERSFYFREMKRSLGSGSGVLQRELLHLTEIGILIRTQVGNQVHYQANQASPVYEDLRRFLTKTAGIADAIRLAFAPLAYRIQVAFIYGSVATAAHREASDVDVMVIGDIVFEDISRALDPLEHELGREINATVYPPDEFRSKVRSEHHFITSVLRQERIPIIGGDHELEGVVGERLGDRASNIT
jgi:predicted nucleotidyltransferase